MKRGDRQIGRDARRSACPARVTTAIIHRQSSLMNTKGFTLIELLVVLGIIALLMAILLATLQRVRSQARGVACQANLHQWGLTISMYADENDGRLPELYGTGWRQPDGSWEMFQASSLDINYYHNDFVLCPMARRWAFNPDPRMMKILARRTDHEEFFIAGSKSTAWCWLWAGADSAVSSSYGFNNHLSALPRDKYPGRTRNHVPILLDCTAWTMAVRLKNEPPAYDDEPSDVGLAAMGCDMKGVCINRHGGGVNSLFLDWSVRKVGLKELWTLKWVDNFNTANDWTKAGGVKPEDWPQWMRKFKDY